MDENTSGPSKCRICGYPLSTKNLTGLCSNRTPACRRARDKLTAAEKPGKLRTTIKTGDVFGRWTALEDCGHADQRVRCRCECGTERGVHGTLLTRGRSRSCGLCVRSRPRPPREPYLKAGSVFGRLTLLEDVAYAHDKPRWRCECGNDDDVRVIASAAKNGHTASCGCILRELRIKHGLSKHPLYSVWKGILMRCYNPGYKPYEWYGLRGIAVCERWRNDVSAFIADVESEIGPRPEGKYANGRALYELDRTNNNGNYEPGNIRWSGRSVQMQNRRKVPKLTQEILALTRERDALAAELAALRAEPTP